MNSMQTSASGAQAADLPLPDGARGETPDETGFDGVPPSLDDEALYFLVIALRDPSVAVRERIEAAKAVLQVTLQLDRVRQEGFELGRRSVVEEMRKKKGGKGRGRIVTLK